jgi:hypothetical protein
MQLVAPPSTVAPEVIVCLNTFYLAAVESGATVLAGSRFSNPVDKTGA